MDTSAETYSLYCLIYIIPLSVFYLLFAIHLFKNKNNKEFKSPFFAVLRVLAVVDLTALLSSCICMRMGYLLSQISFLQPPGKYNVISTIFQYVMVVAGGVQAWLHVIMALNRLTAILFPHSYNSFWEGKFFYLIISIAFIIPGILYSWILYFGGHLLSSPVFNTYVIDTLRTNIPGLHKATINTVITASTCCLAFVFDFLTFILLRKNHLIKSNASKYKQEFRLLTVAAAFLVVHAFFLATAIYTLSLPMQPGILLLVFLQTTTEAQCLISPFCVLLVDRNFRSSFFYQKPKAITPISILDRRPTIKLSI